MSVGQSYLVTTDTVPVDTHAQAPTHTLSLSPSRYDLFVEVSDRLWQQTNVQANVTVMVKELDPTSLSHAVPIIVFPVSAAQVTRNWLPTVSFMDSFSYPNYPRILCQKVTLTPSLPTEAFSIPQTFTSTIIHINSYLILFRITDFS